MSGEAPSVTPDNAGNVITRRTLVRQAKLDVFL
jgi:hypothetical protein